MVKYLELQIYHDKGRVMFQHLLLLMERFIIPHLVGIGPQIIQQE